MKGLTKQRTQVYTGLNLSPGISLECFQFSSLPRHKHLLAIFNSDHPRNAGAEPHNGFETVRSAQTRVQSGSQQMAAATISLGNVGRVLVGPQGFEPWTNGL
jgi:hypothetical protein